MALAAGSIRIGQISAFYGDRDDGARQLLESGVDVLVGDYLAELTMLVLRKNQLRGRPGYATTFLRQIRDQLSTIAEQGVKVISNAGGLDPLKCAEDLRAEIAEQGLDLTVAAVMGDNILPELDQLIASGENFKNIDSGTALDTEGREVLAANAYLGMWPIVEALRAGADIVVTSRVTDASVVMAPAAWHFGWQVDDWDKLAGSLVAGHVIECGAQVTAGQYSLFDDHDDLGLPGMPIAIISEDGSCTITKAAGTGGAVTSGTVTAQLLYEIQGPLYENPDVVADFTSVNLTELGADLVRIDGVRGSAPSDTLKVSLSYDGGYRNTAIVGLTGGRIEKKNNWLRQEVQKLVGPPDSFDGFRWSIVGPALSEDGSNDETTAFVVISAKDSDRAKVARKSFTMPITQLAVSNIPGYYLLTPPQTEQLFAVYWPTLVPKTAVRPAVVMPGEEPRFVPWVAPTRGALPHPARTDAPSTPSGQASVAVPLRDLVGTRSGDKGGNANIGVWARDSAGYGWLHDFLTVERLRELIPESEGLPIERYEFPNLGGLNFVIKGYLEDGVASCLRIDAQAKGLGEYLSSRTVMVPSSVVPR